ncbi:hypothetical protein [Cohnella rhizosphaerae]|uniref:Uncharacterized protein n=1 Tax=Cohnella rhizosphaerae TaxID=1457232 RepID=A0A9X4QSQ5_9BACL|nr:hypothetical protein [Cohnella rhizosphaerae]MDG0809830.1 hypothetical protein [Cohnella rhizosphaerae]
MTKQNNAEVRASVGKEEREAPELLQRAAKKSRHPVGYAGLAGRSGRMARNLRERLKRQSLKLKLVGTTILLFLFTVSLVSFLSYDRYTRDFQRQSNERTQQTLDQLSLNIDNYIDDLFRLSLSPYNNLQVLQLLDEPPPRYRSWTAHARAADRRFPGPDDRHAAA